MKIRITHVAWDSGAVDNALHSVLGDLANVAKSKTTATMCGRRVTSDLIDNDNPICQGCIEEKRQAQRMERKLAFLATNYGRGKEDIDGTKK